LIIGPIGHLFLLEDFRLLADFRLLELLLFLRLELFACPA
jgi:hypothetical protein